MVHDVHHYRIEFKPTPANFQFARQRLREVMAVRPTKRPVRLPIPPGVAEGYWLPEGIRCTRQWVLEPEPRWMCRMDVCLGA
jgi:hypothetical protein